MATIEEKVKEVIAESNGEQFWRRKFDYDESLERVILLERRGIEFQVKVGLELLRVKWQLKHGEFIAYLVNAGFQNTDTPGRRLKVAREYMTFLGLLESPKLINPAENEVSAALEVAYSENPQFADFQAYCKAKLDVNDFFDRMHPKYREQIGMKVGAYEIIGFNPFDALNRLARKWPRMTPVEKGECFELLHNYLIGLKDFLQKVKNLEPDIQSGLARVKVEGKTAERVSNFMREVKTEDWEIDSL